LFLQNNSFEDDVAFLAFIFYIQATNTHKKKDEK
jgi:hypothetical protein